MESGRTAKRQNLNKKWIIQRQITRGHSNLSTVLFLGSDKFIIRKGGYSSDSC